MPWADVANSGKEALEKWQMQRHAYVFADIADLGDGMTGARLAAMLRKQSADVTIILMTDKVLPLQMLWAQRNGANTLITRTAQAIATCLPNGIPTPNEQALPSRSESAREIREAVIRVVDEHLQKYARLGPARSVVLMDALQDLIHENNGQFPSIDALAIRVSNDITSASERNAFLNSFGGAT